MTRCCEARRRCAPVRAGASDRETPPCRPSSDGSRPDQDRTRKICADIVDAQRRGRNTLVFTDRTSLIEALRTELSTRHGLEPAVLKGGMGNKA